MTSTLRIDPISQSEIEDYGQVRVRDQAFNAVQKLWRRRKAAGMKQSDLAAKLNWDPAVVSKKLSGPANWTFKTFGALVEALDGEADIDIFGKEDVVTELRNHRAYDDFPAYNHAVGIMRINAQPAQPRAETPSIRITSVVRN